MQHAGDVLMFVEISDQGFVCAVRKLSGFDASADEQALSAAKAMQFAPARKNGHAVPVAVTIQLTFWRDADGRLVMEAIPKQGKQADSPASKDAAPILR